MRNYETDNHYRVRKVGVEHSEIRLVLAILEEAISCFKKNLFATTKPRRRLFKEAEEWIMADDEDGPFSFHHICDVLDVNPTYLQRKLRTWRDLQLSATRVRPTDVDDVAGCACADVADAHRVAPAHSADGQSCTRCCIAGAGRGA